MKQGNKQITTKICAAFCGAGKTYICNNTNIKAIEIEYWKYKENGLRKNILMI